MVNVSILILNWNTSKDTIECLDSLKKQTYKDFEVVLIDNFSRENDYQKLVNYKKGSSLRINLVRMKSNLGFTGGNNTGLKKSKGKYICLLNNDTIVDKNFLKELLVPFKTLNYVGATSPKIFFYGNRKTKILQHAGRRITYYGAAVESATGKKDSVKFDREIEDKCLHGAAFIISRKVLEKIGEMLCNYYFIYFEEVDLSWRLRSSGFKIIFNPKSIVYHKGSVSMKTNRKISNQEILSTRNKYLTFFRNLKVWDFFLIFPLMFSYDMGRIAKNMIKGNPLIAVGFFTGFFNFLRSTGNVKKPRKGKISELI